jgi:hypothetical protein
MYDEFGNYIGGANKGGYYSPQFNTGFMQSLQNQPMQTIGDYTGLGTDTAPTVAMPTSLPLKYYDTVPAMKSIPLSQMDLSGGKLAPGVLSGGVETATNLVGGAGAAGLGGAAGVAALASKANPYLAMGTAALGAIQTIGGIVGLARTKQPEGFKLTPKMQQAIGESESAARYGLGAQQIALAQQNQREAQNTQLYNARSLSGGNLSRAIFGANTYSRLMAGNQLAAQDFAAQQQKVRYRDQMFGQEQSIANQNVQLAQQDYMRKQQAYGGAMSSGLTNLGSFFNLQNALRYNQTT